MSHLLLTTGRQDLRYEGRVSQVPDPGLIRTDMVNDWCSRIHSMNLERHGVKEKDVLPLFHHEEGIQ